MVYSPVWAQIQRRPRPFNWNTAISRGHKSHRQPGYEGKLFRCMGYPGGGGWGVRPGSTCHATVWDRGSGSRGGIWAGGDRSDPPGAGRPPDEGHSSTSSVICGTNSGAEGSDACPQTPDKTPPSDSIWIHMVDSATQHIDSVYVQRWASVTDASPALNQHRSNVLHLLRRSSTTLDNPFTKEQAPENWSPRPNVGLMLGQRRRVLCDNICLCLPSWLLQDHRDQYTRILSRKCWIINLPSFCVLSSYMIRCLQEKQPVQKRVLDF